MYQPMLAGALSLNTQLHSPRLSQFCHVADSSATCTHTPVQINSKWILELFLTAIHTWVTRYYLKVQRALINCPKAYDLCYVCSWYIGMNPIKLAEIVVDPYRLQRCVCRVGGQHRTMNIRPEESSQYWCDVFGLLLILYNNCFPSWVVELLPVLA